jgi:hypothetical protein
MPAILTDADIARHDSAPPVLTDADIDRLTTESPRGATGQKTSAFSDFIQNSPIGAVQFLAEAMRHPQSAVSGLLHAGDAPLQSAKDAWKQGDYGAAAVHFFNYLISPIGGAAMDAAGNDFNRGEYLHGLAKTGGIATSIYAGAKAPQLLDTATDVAPRVIAATRAAVKEGAPDVAAGVGKAVVGEVAGKIPGLEWPVRIGIQYPAVRQIGRGLKQGAAAAKSAYAGEAAGAAPDIAAAPAADAEDAGMLDDFAQSLAGRKFKNLTQDEQESVRTLVSRATVRQPAPTETPAAAPVPGPEKTIDLGGMGSAITGNLYAKLFEKLQAGDLTELGKPSRVLQSAWEPFQRGEIKSPEDLRAFVNGEKPTPQPSAGPAAAPAVREPLERQPGEKYSDFLERVKAVARTPDNVGAAADAQRAADLDDLSQALTRRPYAKLTQQEKHSVEQIYARGTTTPATRAPAPPPAIATGALIDTLPEARETLTPEMAARAAELQRETHAAAPAPPPPASNAATLAQQLRDELLKSGGLTAEQISIPEAGEEPNPAGVAKIAAARAAKAAKLAQALNQFGISLEAAKGMTETEWNMLGRAANVSVPGSGKWLGSDTAGETLFRLRQMEAAAQPEAQPAAAEPAPAPAAPKRPRRGKLAAVKGEK